MYDETAKPLFDLQVDAFAHGCNIQGIMNAGIAREFKERYPQMFREYQAYCRSGDFQLGDTQFYHSPDQNMPHVINVAIQLDLRNGARIEHIKQGLEKVEAYHAQLGIKTLAMPRMGCGLGGLDWKDVRPIVQDIFRNSNLEVVVSTYESMHAR